MTNQAVFQGDYTDIRFVKGRKVCQIIVELPIEAGAAFVAAFGAPNPSTTVPVALARIDPNARPERKPGGNLAQRAGILCGEGAFVKFLDQKSSIPINTVEEAANALRLYCLVASRADLDHNPEAARKFLDLEASYKAWLRVAA